MDTEMTHTANTDARSALARIQARADKWQHNPDTSWVNVRLGDLRAILSALPQVRGIGKDDVEAFWHWHKPAIADTDEAREAIDAFVKYLAAAPKPTTEDAVPEARIDCVGCEGTPAPENDPCAICGGTGEIRALYSYVPCSGCEAAVGAERERGFDLLLLKALLCLSGFAGEGLQIEGFEDPADVYHEIAEAIGMEDADDDDLRAHIKIESRRTIDGARP